MKNAMTVLVCGCFLFGCDEGVNNATDTDTSNPCALKGDRPSYCDEDIVADKDSEAPPVCGDGECTNTGYYDSETCDTCPADCGKCHFCGDGECQSWDMLHAAPYMWEDGTAEDCGNCAEDCMCDAWGFTCKVTGTYDDAWQGDKSECGDDPWYEFKLAITGTYEDAYGAQFTIAQNEFATIPDCSSGAFQLGDSGGLLCFTEPKLSTFCPQPTMPIDAMFVCDMLAKDFGDSMDPWCKALPPEQHCTDDCGWLGVKLTLCSGTVQKISHQLMQ